MSRYIHSHPCDYYHYCKAIIWHTFILTLLLLAILIGLLARQPSRKWNINSNLVSLTLITLDFVIAFNYHHHLINHIQV